MQGSAIAATGRRKSAVARVRLRPGTGKRLVNGKEPLAYFGRATLVQEVEKPFEVTGRGKEFDLVATVHGGGVAGQAGAVRLGIARALLEHDPTGRRSLRGAALLTRDPRAKERKKYGQAAARKRFQFSKR